MLVKIHNVLVITVITRHFQGELALEVCQPSFHWLDVRQLGTCGMEVHDVPWLKIQGRWARYPRYPLNITPSPRELLSTPMAGWCLKFQNPWVGNSPTMTLDLCSPNKLCIHLQLYVCKTWLAVHTVPPAGAPAVCHLMSFIPQYDFYCTTPSTFFNIISQDFQALDVLTSTCRTWLVLHHVTTSHFAGAPCQIIPNICRHAGIYRKRTSLNNT